MVTIDQEALHLTAKKKKDNSSLSKDNLGVFSTHSLTQLANEFNNKVRVRKLKKTPIALT